MRLETFLRNRRRVRSDDPSLTGPDRVPRSVVGVGTEDPDVCVSLGSCFPTGPLSRAGVSFCSPDVSEGTRGRGGGVRPVN